MEYLALTVYLILYLLGAYLYFYMLTVIIKITYEEIETPLLIIASFIWPIATIWYMYKHIKDSLQTNSK